MSWSTGGCGLSDGDYISLGWWERDDVASVVRHLRADAANGPLALWGRSMGAATALLYAAVDGGRTVGALVLDSPFASFKQLALEKG